MKTYYYALGGVTQFKRETVSDVIVTLNGPGRELQRVELLSRDWPFSGSTIKLGDRRYKIAVMVVMGGLKEDSGSGT